MKQPMNHTNNKAASVRKMRTTASRMKGLTNIYKRVDKWDERVVGDKIVFIVSLLPPWSFSETECMPVKNFDSTHDAMKGIHATYIETEEMIFNSKRIKSTIPTPAPVPKTDLERLKDLVEASVKR